jgi:hypothetical protein
MPRGHGPRPIKSPSYKGPCPTEGWLAQDGGVMSYAVPNFQRCFSSVGQGQCDLKVVIGLSSLGVHSKWII